MNTLIEIPSSEQLIIDIKVCLLLCSDKDITEEEREEEIKFLYNKYNGQ